MKVLVIMSHPLLSDQKKDLMSLGFNQIKEIPPELSKIWSQIPPHHDYDSVEEHLKPVLKWIKKENPDAIVVAGELTASMIIVSNVRGRIPVYTTTTKRESVETVAPNGEVVKTAVFKHVKFRKIA